MTTSKQIILNRIREGLKDVPVSEFEQQPPLERTYEQTIRLTRQELTARFSERAGEYKAGVSVINESELTGKIADACQRQNVKKLVIPDGTPDSWLPHKSGLIFLKDNETPLTKNELDESDGVLTGCALAIAQTGTIVLDGGRGQGRRVLTLLPDYHLCIVHSEQIVGIVPEAFSRLETRISQNGMPVTFISGPSATSDIELKRVEGVHGPRRLDILIVIRDVK